MRFRFHPVDAVSPPGSHPLRPWSSYPAVGVSLSGGLARSVTFRSGEFMLGFPVCIKVTPRFPCIVISFGKALHDLASNPSTPQEKRLLLRSSSD